MKHLSYAILLAFFLTSCSSIFDSDREPLTTMSFDFNGEHWESSQFTGMMRTSVSTSPILDTNYMVIGYKHIGELVNETNQIIELAKVYMNVDVVDDTVWLFPITSYDTQATSFEYVIFGESHIVAEHVYYPIPGPNSWAYYESYDEESGVVEGRFSVDVYNRDDSTKIEEIRNGQFKALLYR